jgi:hypothetical protein
MKAIQADGNALQARVFEGLGFAPQQRAVGGEGDIQRLACRCFKLAKQSYQHLNVFAQQWLAASKAQFLHAMRYKYRSCSCYLFKAQQRIVR